MKRLMSDCFLSLIAMGLKSRVNNFMFLVCK